MASSFFIKPKSFSIGSLSAEEKKEIIDTNNEVVDDSMSEISTAGSISVLPTSPEVRDSSRSRVMLDKSDTSRDQNGTTNTRDNDSDLKWSATLATPSTHAAYTPAADIASKENLHGLALKLSVDRANLLSRTGKTCTSLLTDVASLHDELSQTIFKQYPPALRSAAAGTPMEEFATQVNSCIISFAGGTQQFGNRLRQDIIRPWMEFNNGHVEKTTVYQDYVDSRGKCTVSRKEALKMRQKYVGAVQDAEVAIQSLKKARAAIPKKSDKSTPDTTSCSIEDERDDIQWEKALKGFGKKYDIMKQCDSVANALGEVQSSEGQYCKSVELENSAVSNAQDLECKGLDDMQANEEERIIFMLLTLDRFIQVGREALTTMSLDLIVEPMNLEDAYTANQTDSSLVSSSTTSSIFMTPRRRTQSEELPAINETRMLNLPDTVAELRDDVRSHLAKQSARLKTLKAVSSFNEGLAGAIETFASGLFARLENEGYGKASDGKNPNPLDVMLNKNEGQEVLSEWNKVIQSLLAYATHATQLANQIKRGNSELYNILLPAKRDLKGLYENEETRWKNLCDSAKVETQAKMKQKQYMNDLQKAETRLSLADEDGTGDNAIESQPSQDEDAKNPKPNFIGQSMKMNSSMNKAMGKMFAVLPGGGEDVMNKMLRPEQKKAIMEKNVDEAKKKSMRASESLSAASDAKHQSIAVYESETETALQKFKSNERYVWAQMQKSLENSVMSVKTFRDAQQAAMPASGDITANTNVAALADISDWITKTELRVEEYRDRQTSEWIDKENGCEFGFSLPLALVESSDIKELAKLVVYDNDDDFGVGFEVEYEDPEKPLEPVQLPDVAEDPIIKDMDPIFTKSLKNVSVESYYTAAWSEEIPLYQPWLEKKGSFDVSVTDWEVTEGGFKHDWSGETFTQRRVIKFKFKRTTHLYIGPPIAGVTQTQYCRLVGNDRCVTMMTAEMDGIPYSDVFAVEVRWSARRQGSSDIIIDAGMHVRFIKSSMFAKQIKSGTLTETKPIHLSLYETIKSAIASGNNTDEELVEAEETPDVETRASIDIVQVDSMKKEPERKESEATMSLFKIVYNSLWSLPIQYKVLSGVFFFGSVVMFTRGGLSSEQQQLDALNRKVDQLTIELSEIKSLLHTIVHTMKDK